MYRTDWIHNAHSDGIVTEVLHQVFDKMQGASNDMIVGSAVQKQMAMIRSELQRARAENTKANKEYESLKAEVLNGDPREKRPAARCAD